MVMKFPFIRILYNSHLLCKYLVIPSFTVNISSICLIDCQIYGKFLFRNKKKFNFQVSRMYSSGLDYLCCHNEHIGSERKVFYYYNEYRKLNYENIEQCCVNQ